MQVRYFDDERRLLWSTAEVPMLLSKGTALLVTEGKRERLLWVESVLHRLELPLPGLEYLSQTDGNRLILDVFLTSTEPEEPQ